MLITKKKKKNRKKEMDSVEREEDNVDPSSNWIGMLKKKKKNVLKRCGNLGSRKRGPTDKFQYIAHILSTGFTLTN